MASSSNQVGSFARSKRAEVTVPALFICVDADQCSASKDLVQGALKAGTTAVVVKDSEGGDDGQLFEAAVELKDLIRGRAALLVEGRADIAAAAGADGVLLDSGSLPAVIARRTLQSGVEDKASVVGKKVNGLKEALKAEKEGVDLIVLPAGSGSELAKEVRCSVTVPVIVEYQAWGDLQGGEALRELLQKGGADGASFPCYPPGDEPEMFQEEVTLVRETLVNSSDIELTDLCLTTMDEESEEEEIQESGKDSQDTEGLVTKPKVERGKYNVGGEEVLEEEKKLMAEVTAFIEAVAPDLPEKELVVEAAMALEEPFLVVVVGEFNAGKSSVINTLLGSRFLREGVLPTTNEISVLRHGEQERVTKQTDGYYERYIPSEILNMVSIVDTPGTNVILDRQQQLTEEFVPRADLVLFVISADRPFTESELTFLKYIRKWDKRVVYILNKADMLAPYEVEEVTEFVVENSQRALGVGNSVVLPVSAKSALRAKMRVGGASAAEIRGPKAALEEGQVSGINTTYNPSKEELEADEEWVESGFGAAEDWILGFLAGTGDSAGDAMRLKLNTPLAVATALLESCGRSLEADMESALNEVEAARMTRETVGEFRATMLKDAQVQRRRAARVIENATQRAEGLIDRILKAANVSQLSSYLTGSSGVVGSAYSAEVLATSEQDLEEALAEHTAWLEANCTEQSSNIMSYIADRGFPSVSEVVEENDETEESMALVVVKEFDQNAAVTLLEEEVREAVNGTVGPASGAVAVGLLSTAILPTTLEDILALALASVVAYVGLLNLPMKRTDTKSKVRRAGNKFAQEVEASMEQEAIAKVDRSVEEVLEALKPWEEAAQAEVERVVDNEAKQQMLQQAVKALQQRVRQL